MIFKRMIYFAAWVITVTLVAQLTISILSFVGAMSVIVFLCSLSVEMAKAMVVSDVQDTMLMASSVIQDSADQLQAYRDIIVKLEAELAKV